MFFEVLVEGSSDIPPVREVFIRRFNLQENTDFKIHPHQGKGKLPSTAYLKTNPRDRSLLHQLPAKLRGYSHLSEDYCIIILVDADRDNCMDLKNSMVQLHEQLFYQPPCVLFRIAVEEIESWFIADIEAVKMAYPTAKIQKIESIPPDSIVGAWEHLAESLGKKICDCDGSDKLEWAKKISPHLDLQNPKSISLFHFVQGIERIIQSRSN